MALVAHNRSNDGLASDVGSSNVSPKPFSLPACEVTYSYCKFSNQYVISGCSCHLLSVGLWQGTKWFNTIISLKIDTHSKLKHTLECTKVRSY